MRRALACIAASGILVAVWGCTHANPLLVCGTASPDFGIAPLAVRLDASGCVQGSSGVTEYSWTATSDSGTEVMGSGPEATLDIVLSIPGSYKVELRVVTGDGRSTGCRVGTVTALPPADVGDVVVLGPADPTGIGEEQLYDAGRVIAKAGSECTVRLFSNGHQTTAQEVKADASNLYLMCEDGLDRIPDGYYTDASHLYPSRTPVTLEAFLVSYRDPRPYEANAYDCSNMCAHLEWALENAGYDARIVNGPTPWDAFDDNPNTDPDHAWVMVYFPDGTRVAIEATDPAFSPMRAPGIIYEDVPWSSEYYDRESYYCEDDDIYSIILFLHCYSGVSIGGVKQGDAKEFIWWDEAALPGLSPG